MKVRVRITPREGVLDPEGRAVQRALTDLGYGQVSELQMGKLIELEVDAANADEARRLVTEMCEKLLANPVIEQYELDFP